MRKEVHFGAQHTGKLFICFVFSAFYIMGSHQVCDSCGVVFEEQDHSTHCDGCDRSYCNWCDGKGVYWVGDKIKCWLCYNPYDRVVSEKELLYFCLDKLGWDKKTVDAKFRKSAAYTNKLDGTTCSECKFDGCETIDKVFTTFEDEPPACRAGVCCACRGEKWKVLLDACNHCKSRAFMERWMAPHKRMREAGIPKDVVVDFAKRIKFNEDANGA